MQKETPSKTKPRKPTLPKKKPYEEMPVPVLPILPGMKIKKKKPLTKVEIRTVNTMNRLIKNKLGGINSILGV